MAALLTTAPALGADETPGPTEPGTPTPAAENGSLETDPGVESAPTPQGDPESLASQVEASSMVMPDEDLDDTTFVPGEGVGDSIATGGIVCQIVATDAHYSSGASGVIAKLKFDCTGTVAAVLTGDGYLFREVPGTMGPYAPKATNLGAWKQVQNTKAAFWVPDKGTSGIFCNENRIYWATWNYRLSVNGEVVASKTITTNVLPPRGGCP